MNEETEWHRVVTFGRTSEVCLQHLGKGSQVYVEGHLKTSSYDNKDGVKMYSTDVIGDSVQFLGGRPDQGGGGGRGGYQGDQGGGRQGSGGQRGGYDGF